MLLDSRLNQICNFPSLHLIIYESMKAFMTWLEVIKKDMKLLELEERMVIDRNDWKRMTRVWDRI